MRREQWLPSHFDPSTLCSLSSFACPGFDQFAFKFCKAAQNRKQKPSSGSRGITPWIGQRLEQTTTVSDLLNDGEQVDGRPRQPV
jgi:hypothetical protein